MCFTVLHAVFSHISAITAYNYETIIFTEMVKERVRMKKTLFRRCAKEYKTYSGSSCYNNNQIGHTGPCFVTWTPLK